MYDVVYIIQQLIIQEMNQKQVLLIPRYVIFYYFQCYMTALSKDWSYKLLHILFTAQYSLLS